MSDEMEKPAVPAGWTERVGAFAISVGKTIDEVAGALKKVIGDPSDQALVVLADTNAASDDDIKEALKSLDIPSGVVKLNLSKLRGPKPVVEAAAKTSGAIQALAILPAVPDDASFIESLKTGGVLKASITEVLSAVKAALAKQVGLYDLPERILEKMESFAEAQDEPFGDDFYRLQKLLTEQRYGEILSVLGVPGKFVSDKRKRVFFEKLDAKLWTALQSFQVQLTAWQQAWMQGAANPGMLMMAMAAGHGGVGMPPGIMAPPDTAPLRASGEEVINEINRVFSGPGIPVARALAYDATRIMGILNEETLPARLGVGNKDQMLKELGISVGAEIVRTEQSVTRYALAIMSLPKVMADAEHNYLIAMIQLGASIPWDKLVSTGSLPRPSGLGGRRSTNSVV